MKNRGEENLCKIRHLHKLQICLVDDYNMRDTVFRWIEEPDIRGKYVRDFLNIQAITYTWSAVQRLFWSRLYEFLPCEECSEHCKSYIQSYPPLLDDHISLMRWVLWIHNYVNERNDKKTRTRYEYIQYMEERYMLVITS